MFLFYGSEDTMSIVSTQDSVVTPHKMEHARIAHGSTLVIKVNKHVASHLSKLFDAWLSGFP